jgi:hypothetical protein
VIDGPRYSISAKVHGEESRHAWPSPALSADYPDATYSPIERERERERENSDSSVPSSRAHPGSGYMTRNPELAEIYPGKFTIILHRALRAARRTSESGNRRVQVTSSQSRFFLSAFIASRSLARALRVTFMQACRAKFHGRIYKEEKEITSRHCPSSDDKIRSGKVLTYARATRNISFAGGSRKGVDPGRKT